MGTVLGQHHPDLRGTVVYLSGVILICTRWRYTRSVLSRSLQDDIILGRRRLNLCGMTLYSSVVIPIFTRQHYTRSDRDDTVLGRHRPTFAKRCWLGGMMHYVNLDTDMIVNSIMLPKCVISISEIWSHLWITRSLSL